jgi:hypothetical protein
MQRVPANGGLFYSPLQSLVFQTEKTAGLGSLSPAQKFPFLAAENVLRRLSVCACRSPKALGG